MSLRRSITCDVCNKTYKVSTIIPAVFVGEEDEVHVCPDCVKGRPIEVCGLILAVYCEATKEPANA